MIVRRYVLLGQPPPWACSDQPANSRFSKATNAATLSVRSTSRRRRLPHAYPWQSGQVSVVCGAHLYALDGAAARNDRAAQGAQNPATWAAS